MGLLAMLAHWAYNLFLRLLRPTFLIFSPYSSHGPTNCHSCHASPLGLLSLFLGFLGPLTSPLPLILPMGLLAVIPAMLAYWACYLFSWASLARLLHLYLLFFLCDWWLSFLPCWSIGLANLLLPFLFLFLSISLNVGLLPLLGLS